MQSVPPEVAIATVSFYLAWPVIVLAIIVAGRRRPMPEIENRWSEWRRAVREQWPAALAASRPLVPETAGLSARLELSGRS